MEKVNAALNQVDFNQLVHIRKHLHQNPEVSLDEHETRAFIKKQLEQLPDLEVVEIGKTGLLASLKTPKSGQSLLFRAELDALPITEINAFQHASRNKGVGHMCGHDGHATLLLGLAQVLCKTPPKSGTVHFLFQPAEEIGEGAKGTLADPYFKSLSIDFVYALHNIPGYPEQAIIIKDHSFTASVKSLILRINGKTSHAAEPENGINPSYYMARLLNELPSLMQPNVEESDFRIISPTHGMFGDDFAYGTSAGYGELRLTIRAWTNKIMDQLETELLHVIDTLALEMKVSVEKEWTQVFAANENHQVAMNSLREVLKTQKFETIERSSPFKWGEDFGLFTQKYKGAMFGLGAGINCPALHNPDYDFPDQILKTGIAVFAGLAYNHLN